MDTNLDGEFLDTAGDLPPSNEEWYEGAAKCYSQDGLTFLDLFDADEHAEYRKENLFYPFTSREEWEVADFLLRSALSMAAIDKLLQLSMIKRLKLSFNNAKDLRGQAEMLPKGPSWKCQVIPSLHGTKIECLESLFSNPLFHNQLDFVPHRVYKTAAQLLRVYSEWLTGDAVWSIQDQLPQGATVLGTVLSSDKTNITTMTGARVAHPLLLGLANIHMHTRTKLSSKVFMLTALLPIPQYLHPNQRMRGMLEDCLIHECLSIVLQPLMKASELGIMMSDPACVRSKTSPFTLASYLQFRDNFHHPAQFWLNGVFVPFWKGWPLSDPAIFLTPEALHHWHKQFYDHDMQWCLAVLGVPEFDFQFSILQPITGYRHFPNRISKLKQVTGRVHRDIQCYIVGLIAGAAPHRFVIAIHALMDIRYLAQSPEPDNNLLASIDRSLALFHDNKDVIMTLGARMGVKRVIDNWHIPKLELMQSITTSTCQVGALIQWSADATEHAHVSEIKDPARRTNNNDYDPQICHHLDQEEKLRRFAVATSLKSSPTDPNLEELCEDEGDEDKDKDKEENGENDEPMDPQTALLEELNHTHTTSNYFSKIRMSAATRHGIPQAHPPRMFLAGSTAVHLNCNPTYTGLKIDKVADQFNIPDLRHALSDFFQRNVRNGDRVFGVGVPRRLLIDHPLNIPFEHVQVWHTVRLQQACLHDPSIVLPAQTMHASPACPGWPKGRQDVAIFNINSAHDWPESGLMGHAVCELQLIMRPIPRRGSRITWHDRYLCYVRSFKIGVVDPVTKMHTLTHTKHVNGTLVGDIVPLTQIRAFISIIPKLGAAADPRLTKSTSAHYHSSFYLNKYFDKQIYDSLYYALQG
ncbi:hypothetical protein EV424DRAFT_1471865 [Suillus variegatus]|nr:hypothetical protein EV424DRAFT_1471865 [Suillus variegatus]